MGNQLVGSPAPFGESEKNDLKSTFLHYNPFSKSAILLGKYTESPGKDWFILFVYYQNINDQFIYVMFCLSLNEVYVCLNVSVILWTSLLYFR